MKVTKLYCDCCEREVESEDDLYPMPIISKIAYEHSQEIVIKDKEICIDCMLDMGTAYHKLSATKVKERDERERRKMEAVNRGR